jgi:hypothetical protein
MKEALRMQHHSLKRLREGLEGGGGSFTGDPGRYVKKGLRYRNLHRGPFTAEENLEYGGRFIYWGLWKMYGGGLLQWGTSLRDSMKGTWMEGSFTGDPKRYVK